MKNQGIPKGQKVTMGETYPAPQLGGITFKAPTMQYVQAIYNQFAGAREQALADLSVYLQNPVGVGEHSSLGEEIKLLIRKVDEYDSLVECLEKHVVKGRNMQETSETSETSEANDNKPNEAP